MELYDNPEELTFPDEEMSDKVSENEESVRQNSNLSDKLAIKQIIGDKLAIIQQDNLKFGAKVIISPKIDNKLAIKEEFVDKLADIVVFLRSTTESNSTVISQLIGKGKSAQSEKPVVFMRIVSLA